MNLCPYLEIGKIVNTHGIKGEVKVLPLTDSVERFRKLKSVFVEKGGTLEKYEIQSVKFLKSTVVIKFSGVDDMDAAEKLRGLYLKVDRKNAVKLPKGSYFICDLLGLMVYDENGLRVGVLKDVMKAPANDIYIVESDDGQELLLPALKSVVKEINIEEKKIVVAMQESLMDDEV